MFHYPYTAMAVSKAGVGSDYGIAFVDSNQMPFDGSKTYKLNIPANPPAKGESDIKTQSILPITLQALLITGILIFGKRAIALVQ